LAADTDEETLILSASVANGTLSHIASESGKKFLNGNSDIKSKFLNFCLQCKYMYNYKQRHAKYTRAQI